MEELKESYENLLETYNFKKLLMETEQILIQNPDDTEALIYKGQALILCSNYDEALKVFQKLFKLKLGLERKIKLKSMINICIQILNFGKKFKNNCFHATNYSKDWYLKLMEHQVKKHQIIIKLNKIDYYNKFFKEKEDNVYIIGPEQNVNNFEGDEIQGVYRYLISKLNKFPCAQVHQNGWLYHYDQIFYVGWENRRTFNNSHLLPLCKLRSLRWEYPDKSKIHKPHPECDLYYSNNLIDKETHNIIQRTLDKLANCTNDYFVPMYQNIIDPNLTVMHQPEADKHDIQRGKTIDKEILRWIATDFIVDKIKIKYSILASILQNISEELTGKKLNNFILKEIISFLPLKKNGNLPSIGRGRICSPISNLDPMEFKELHVAVENVFNAALPMLSQLKKPSLLLPGKIQAVMKAQRIYLKPGEEYSGVWHCDGKNEEIIAVILYYYRVSDNILGGDLEFVDKRPKDFWIGGDCDATEFSYEDAKNYVKEIPHCKVPIKKGTLVVFSNYQFIHRVLQMTYPENYKGDNKAPGGLASRDFLAFFVVDQRAPLFSTLEWKKEITNDQEKTNVIRQQLFLEQLQPSGVFGINDEIVYSTGNGSVSLLGWVKNQIYDKTTINNLQSLSLEFGRNGINNFNLLNLSPPFGRGISWTVDKKILENGAEECEDLKNLNYKKN